MMNTTALNIHQFIFYHHLTCSQGCWGRSEQLYGEVRAWVQMALGTRGTCPLQIQYDPIPYSHQLIAIQNTIPESINQSIKTLLFTCAYNCSEGGRLESIKQDVLRLILSCSCYGNESINIPVIVRPNHAYMPTINGAFTSTCKSENLSWKNIEIQHLQTLTLGFFVHFINCRILKWSLPKTHDHG